MFYVYSESSHAKVLNRQKIYDCNYKVDMLQKQIHAENLHEKSRGRPNGTFGSVWAENYECNGLALLM